MDRLHGDAKVWSQCHTVALSPLYFEGAGGACRDLHSVLFSTRSNLIKPDIGADVAGHSWGVSAKGAFDLNQLHP